jgi:hypothetical protein
MVGDHFASFGDPQKFQKCTCQCLRFPVVFFDCRE